MKKIFAVIPIAILIVLLSSSITAHCASVGFTIRKISDSEWFTQFVLYDFVDWLNETDSDFTNGTIDRTMTFSSYNECIEWINNLVAVNGSVYANYIVPNGRIFYQNNDADYYYQVAVPHRYTTTIESFDSYDDFINPPDPEKSWWEIVWDTFNDYFTNPIPGGWIKNLIDNVFGDDENENTISNSVDIENPTLTPAPTPIPYSTVVIPKTDPVTGDSYYETNYIYNNPSGTPVIQPYPPTSAPSTSSPSGSTEYIPVNGDPYSIPFVNWLTTTTIGDSNYDGLDSIGDGMNSVDEIGSEYIDGIGAAQDATSVLPTSWLLLIGIAAAIPLLAGIISRFLS